MVLSVLRVVQDRFVQVRDSKSGYRARAANQIAMVRPSVKMCVCVCLGVYIWMNRLKHQIKIEWCRKRY